MGLLDFNIAEFVSRMVRGGGVRGRARPTLDDGIIPVVRVGDWTVAPYRTDEKRFFACVPQALFGAAVNSTLAIENASAQPVIIETIDYMPGAAAVASIEESFVDRLVNLGNNSTFATGEGSRPVGAGAGVLFLPSVFLSNNTGALLGGGPVIRRVLVPPLAGPTSQFRTENFDFMVPPGCSYIFQARAVNTTFGVCIRLRAPQQALPTQ